MRLLRPRHAASSAQRRRGPVGGFTLIELLVVIAVISILAAMLMPMVVRAMRAADATECKSNLDQIHAAMMTYVNTYDGYLAPLNTASPHLNWRPGRKWWQLLGLIISDTGVFRCPAKKSTKIGYSYNHRVFTPPRSHLGHLNLWVGPQQLTVCNKPSATVQFCDVGWVTNIHAPAAQWNEDTRNPGCARFPIDMIHGAHDGKKLYKWWNTSPNRPVPRHPGDKTNCAFFDGHVEALLTADLCDDDYFDPDCLYDNR